MTVISAGQLETPISIDRNLIIENDFAVSPPQWEPIAFVWGWVRPLTGRQLEFGREMVSTVTHDVIINNQFTTIQPNDRLRMGDRTLFVRAIINSDEGRWHVRLLCDEIE